jgi:hypothetical protein
MGGSGLLSCDIVSGLDGPLKVLEGLTQQQYHISQYPSPLHHCYEILRSRRILNISFIAFPLLMRLEAKLFIGKLKCTQISSSAHELCNFVLKHCHTLYSSEYDRIYLLVI